MKWERKPDPFRPGSTFPTNAGQVPQDGTLCVLTDGQLAIRLSLKLWAGLQIVGNRMMVNGFSRLNTDETVYQTAEKISHPLKWVGSI
jgi:hypothetical protein